MTSIAKIKQTMARQEKRRTFLEKKIKNELVQAKAKMKRKDKRGALMHMKRKKMYEKEITKIDAVQMTLEQQCFNIEGAQANVEAVNAMKVGADQMKTMQQAVNVDDVADLRDEIEEQQMMGNEVSDLLAEGMGAAAMMDEDDLAAELADLEAEDASAAMAAAPMAPQRETSSDAIAATGRDAFNAAMNLPSAPSGAIEQDDDEAALAALQAEFA